MTCAFTTKSYTVMPGSHTMGERVVECGELEGEMRRFFTVVQVKIADTPNGPFVKQGMVELADSLEEATDMIGGAVENAINALREQGLAELKRAQLRAGVGNDANILARLSANGKMPN